MAEKKTKPKTYTREANEIIRIYISSKDSYFHHPSANAAIRSLIEKIKKEEQKKVVILTEKLNRAIKQILSQ